MTSVEPSYRLLVAHAAVHAAGYIGIAALADLSGGTDAPMDVKQRTAAFPVGM
jgi:hypothetical protein